MVGNVADVLSRIVGRASKKLPGAKCLPPSQLGGPDCTVGTRRQLVYTVFYLTSNCGLSSSSNTNARSASLNINIKRMLLILSSHTIILYKFMREKYYEIYNLYTMVHCANNSIITLFMDISSAVPVSVNDCQRHGIVSHYLF
jgi:hypothetical protein